ncbi:MAG: aldehyde dehydrogenase family protein [Candidatus Aenigmarchaeota archaeon]|nr:aldehyde dehydrogenase family protein [Candidatus Aenigmarchaeota archaeon]
MKFQTINPVNGDTIQEYDSMGKSQVEQKVKSARTAFEAWKETKLMERNRLVKKLGKRLIKKKKDLAESITTEMGKPIKESTAEIEKCAALCEYFAKHAKRFLRDEKIKTEYQKSYAAFQPLGVVGSVMCWDFPMWQALRFAVPTILAGNVEIVKPSSITPESGGALLERLFKDCKFPLGVFSAVIGDSNTGSILIESNIDAVSFTGSSETGIKVASMAMKDLKKVVLELGGSDPFIVLGDANVDSAVDAAVAARFLNCGQSCIAAKRFIIIREVADQFIGKFTEKAKALKVGDPMQPDTDMGPMVREDKRQKLEKQINASTSQGAKILLGGQKQEGKGFFFQPTVLGSVNNDMVISKEEVYGPAAPIIVVDNEDDTIRIANDTQYGLGASIWTENREKAEQMAKKINAGLIFVNKGVRSDPRLPFGGVKKSGFGRELYKYGMLEMTNIKSVVIN